MFAFGEKSQIEAHGNMAKAPPGSSYVLERNVFLLQPGEIVERPEWRGRPADVLVMRSQFGAWKPDEASKVADPLFVDPAKSDFRLRPARPAGRSDFHR